MLLFFWNRRYLDIRRFKDCMREVSSYAHTREECEEKLKMLIVEMKAEIAEAQRLKDPGEGDGRASEEKKGKRGKKSK